VLAALLTALMENSSLLPSVYINVQFALSVTLWLYFAKVNLQDNSGVHGGERQVSVAASHPFCGQTHSYHRQHVLKRSCLLVPSLLQGSVAFALAFMSM